jgi:hypothetical protein
MKTKKRRPWTEQHVRDLKALARKKPVSTIANKLRRTQGATRQKAFSLGLSLKKSRHTVHAAVTQRRAA